MDVRSKRLIDVHESGLSWNLAADPSEGIRD